MTRTIEGKFPLPEENEIEEHDERPAPKATPQDREGIQRLVNAPWGLNILEQALNSNTPGWIQNGNCPSTHPLLKNYCLPFSASLSVHGHKSFLVTDKVDRLRVLYTVHHCHDPQRCFEHI